jgi:phage baseplate assembly protein W
VPKNGVAVVEQDTYDDVANCVEVICRTPFGFRLDNPDFGFPSLELTNQPILSDEVEQVVQNQEPRATLLMSEQPDLVDTMIDRITVSIQKQQTS